MIFKADHEKEIEDYHNKFLEYQRVTQEDLKVCREGRDSAKEGIEQALKVIANRDKKIQELKETIEIKESVNLRLDRDKDLLKYEVSNLKEQIQERDGRIRQARLRFRFLLSNGCFNHCKTDIINILEILEGSDPSKKEGKQ